MFIRVCNGKAAINTQYIEGLFVSAEHDNGWYVTALIVDKHYNVDIKGPYPTEEMAGKALEELITKIGRDAQ